MKICFRYFEKTIYFVPQKFVHWGEIRWQLIGIDAVTGEQIGLTYTSNSDSMEVFECEDAAWLAIPVATLHTIGFVMGYEMHLAKSAGNLITTFMQQHARIVEVAGILGEKYETS